MAFGPNSQIKFKQSISADVVANRIRIRPANSPAALDTPFDDIPKKAPAGDGYTYIKMSELSLAQKLDGHYDVHITAVDDAGGESGFLEIDNVDFDFEPPAAPTDGSVV